MSNNLDSSNSFVKSEVDVDACNVWSEVSTAFDYTFCDEDLTVLNVLTAAPAYCKREGKAGVVTGLDQQAGWAPLFRNGMRDVAKLPEALAGLEGIARSGFFSGYRAEMQRRARDLRPTRRLREVLDLHLFRQAVHVADTMTTEGYQDCAKRIGVTFEPVNGRLRTPNREVNKLIEAGLQSRVKITHRANGRRLQHPANVFILGDLSELIDALEQRLHHCGVHFVMPARQLFGRLLRMADVEKASAVEALRRERERNEGDAEFQRQLRASARAPIMVDDQQAELDALRDEVAALRAMAATTEASEAAERAYRAAQTDVRESDVLPPGSDDLAPFLAEDHRAAEALAQRWAEVVPGDQPGFETFVRHAFEEEITAEVRRLQAKFGDEDPSLGGLLMTSGAMLSSPKRLREALERFGRRHPAWWINRLDPARRLEIVDQLVGEQGMTATAPAAGPMRMEFDRWGSSAQVMGGRHV